MNTWVLCISITVVLTTLITMLLPDGALSKDIKCVFGLILVITIVQPLISLKDGNLNFDYKFENTEIAYQNSFIYYTVEKKYFVLENNCCEILEENGIKDASISIEYTVTDMGQANVEKVSVNLKNAVIILDNKHIDIIEDIVLPISEYLNISSDKVELYE